MPLESLAAQGRRSNVPAKTSYATPLPNLTVPLPEPVGNFSKYLGDDLYRTEEALLNARADAQPQLEKLGAQLLHGGTAFGSAFLSSLAAPAVMLGYAGAAAVSEDVDFMDFTDNTFLKTISNGHNAIMESTPVYSRAQQSDNLGDWMFSGQFWDELSQGAGFMAALLLGTRVGAGAGGRFLHAAKHGMNMGKGPWSRLGKSIYKLSGRKPIHVLNKATRPGASPFLAADDLAGTLPKWYQKAEPVSSALFARTGEAYIETEGAVREMEQMLQPGLESGEISPEQYEAILQKTKKGVFAGNMLLGVLDAAQLAVVFGNHRFMKMFGKPGSKLARSLGVKSRDLVEEVAEKGGKSMRAKGITWDFGIKGKKGLWDATKGFFKSEPVYAAGVLGFGTGAEYAEEFFQEILVDNARQDALNLQATGRQSPEYTGIGYGDFVWDSMKTLSDWDTYTDTENIKAGIMGAILGGGMSMYGYGRGLTERTPAAEKFAETYNYYNQAASELPGIPKGAGVDRIKSIIEKLEGTKLSEKRRTKLNKELDTLMKKTYGSDGKWDLVDHQRLIQADGEIDKFKAKRDELKEQMEAAEDPAQRKELEQEALHAELAVEFALAQRKNLHAALQARGKAKQLKLNDGYKNNLNQISKVQAEMETAIADPTIDTDTKRHKIEAYRLRLIGHMAYGAYLADEQDAFLMKMEEGLLKAREAKAANDTEMQQDLMDNVGADTIDEAIDIYESIYDDAQVAYKSVGALEEFATFRALPLEGEVTKDDVIRVVTHQKATSRLLGEIDAEVKALETKLQGNIQMPFIPVNYKLDENGNLTTRRQNELDNQGDVIDDNWQPVPNELMEKVPELVKLRTALQKKTALQEKMKKATYAEKKLGEMQPRYKELVEKINKKRKAELYRMPQDIDTMTAEEIQQEIEKFDAAKEAEQQKARDLEEQKKALPKEDEKGRKEIQDQINDIRKNIDKEFPESKAEFLEALAEKKEMDAKMEEYNKDAEAYNEVSQELLDVQKTIQKNREGLEQDILYAGLSTEEVQDFKSKKEYRRQLANANQDLLEKYDSFKLGEKIDPATVLEPEMYDWAQRDFLNFMDQMWSQWEKAQGARRAYQEFKEKYGKNKEELTQTFKDLEDALYRMLREMGFSKVVSKGAAFAPMVMYINGQHFSMNNPRNLNKVFGALFAKSQKFDSPAEIYVPTPEQLFDILSDMAMANIANAEIEVVQDLVRQVNTAKDKIKATRRAKFKKRKALIKKLQGELDQATKDQVLKELEDVKYSLNQTAVKLDGLNYQLKESKKNMKRLTDGINPEGVKDDLRNPIVPGQEQTRFREDAKLAMEKIKNTFAEGAADMDIPGMDKFTAEVLGYVNELDKEIASIQKQIDAIKKLPPKKRDRKKLRQLQEDLRLDQMLLREIKKPYNMDDVEAFRDSRALRQYYSFMKRKLDSFYMGRRLKKRRKKEKEINETEEVVPRDLTKGDIGEFERTGDPFSLTVMGTNVPKTTALANLSFYKGFDEELAKQYQEEHWEMAQLIKEYFNEARNIPDNLIIKIVEEELDKAEGVPSGIIVKKAMLGSFDKDGDFIPIKPRGAKKLWMFVRDPNSVDKWKKTPAADRKSYREWYNEIGTGDMFSIDQIFLSPKLNANLNGEVSEIESNLHVKVNDADKTAWTFDPQPVTAAYSDMDIEIIPEGPWAGYPVYKSKRGKKSGFLSTTTVSDEDAKIILDLAILAMQGESYDEQAITIDKNNYSPIDLIQQYIRYGYTASEKGASESDYHFFLDSREKVTLNIRYTEKVEEGKYNEFNYQIDLAKLSTQAGRDSALEVIKKLRYNVKEGLLNGEKNQGNFFDLKKKGDTFISTGTRPYKSRLIQDKILLTYGKLGEQWDNPMANIDKTNLNKPSEPKKGDTGTTTAQKPKRRTATVTSTKTQTKDPNDGNPPSGRRKAGKRPKLDPNEPAAPGVMGSGFKLSPEEMEKLNAEIAKKTGLNPDGTPRQSASSLEANITEFMKKLTKEQRTKFRDLRNKGLIITEC